MLNCTLMGSAERLWHYCNIKNNQFAPKALEVLRCLSGHILVTHWRYSLRDALHFGLSIFPHFPPRRRRSGHPTPFNTRTDTCSGTYRDSRVQTRATGAARSVHFFRMRRLERPQWFLIVHFKPEEPELESFQGFPDLRQREMVLLNVEEQIPAFAQAVEVR